jgi:serine phosphatase RsbU (regulator of sigma subunit)
MICCRDGPELPPLQASVELTSGDWLLIYSDGISEATTEGGEDFGDNGLFDWLRRLGTGTAAGVCDGS